MTAHATLEPLSEETYITSEKTSPIRHEFVAGQIFAMVGASQAHGGITLNIASFLHDHLRGTSCRVFSSDMKVKIESAEAFYYPDIVVSCEPFDSKAFFVQTPCLIIEILSPSTEAIDRREKRLNYQKLDSLREYLLVSQTEPKIEVYRRGIDASVWQLDIYGPEDITVELHSVECGMPVSSIYEGMFVGE